METGDHLRSIYGLCLACALLLTGPPAAGSGEDAAAEAEPAPDGDDGLGLEDEFALLEEESIIYTAAKHRQRISDSPSTVTVITRAQIETSHCFDLSCLLRMVPELEIRRYRPLYHAVGARALGAILSDKGLLIVDGMELNSEIFGFPFWGALPIHLSDIERIEVIRGPGSSLYGANAHSMVVSITTRKPGDQLASVYLGGGEHGATDLHLQLGEAIGGWRFGLAGGFESNGYWATPGVKEREITRGQLVIERDWSSGTTRFAASATGITGRVYTAMAPIQLHDSLMATAQLEHKTDWLKAHLWFNLFDSDMEMDLPLVYRDVELGRFPERLPILSTSADAEVQVDWSFFDGNLVIGGINYRWLTYMSDSNAPPTIHQHRVGLFGQFEQRLWDQLLLTAGLRLDYNSITPFTWSPRLAAVWRFVPDHLIRASFGRAFRKPSFINSSIHIKTVEGSAVAPNLGEFFRRNIGNPDLDNENVTAFELGYRGEVADGELVLEANGFFNMYRNNINFIYDVNTNNLGLPDLSCPADGGPCASSIIFRNKGWEINSAGGSASVSWRPRDDLRLQVNYTYRYSWYSEEARDTTGELIAKAGSTYELEPDHFGNAILRYTPTWGLRLSLALHAHADMYQERSEDGQVFSKQVPVHTPAVFFASASLGYRLELDGRWLEATVKAHNLFNQRFQDATSVTRPDGALIGAQIIGRTIMLVLQAGL